MENEVKSVKDYSDEYTVSLSDLRGRELFTNLHYVLMSFPFTNYVLKSAPSPLHELLKNDYEEVIESLKKYLNIGYALRDELIINKLKFELPKLRADSDIAYYAAIIGPSFMGKTQTAFTLSHCMTVLYINLPIGSRKEVQLKISQDIYKAFFSFSTILNRIIAEDLHELELTGEDFNASDFYNEAHQIMPFKILGLIFSLIKLKMLRADINIFEWYKSIVDIERVWIPSMTIETFLNAIRDSNINLDEVVIFIDELSRDPDNEKRTKFTRNICRFVRIPVILSGTNTRVNNLFGKSGYLISGFKNILSTWVKIITELPKSTLKSLGCSISFKGIGGLKYELGEFVVFDDSGNSGINYEGLFNILLSNDRMDPGLIADLRSILEFLFEQSKTNLPGVAYLSISQALQQIYEMTDIVDIKELWKDVLIFVSKALVTRKVNLRYKYGLIASIHSLTFPSLTLKKSHECGENSAKKVDSHYFYFGEKGGDTIFDLSLLVSNSLNEEIIESIQLFKSDSIQFVDSCYFPELKDDIMLNIGCWQVWWNLIDKNSRLFTIGHLYQGYLEEAGIFKLESNATVPDAFSLELLAHWCICYASHKDLNGYTSTIDVLKEFIINVQSCYYKAPHPSQPVITRINQLMFNFDLFPASLSSFLKYSSVPYLIQSDSFTSSFDNFIRLGKSDRLENSKGWDVNFDLFFGNIRCKGYIECKLWNAAVGLPLVLPYYKKAGHGGYKMSILLAKKVQVSMQGGAAANKFIANQPKQAKTDNDEKSNTDYIGVYEELWRDPQEKYNLNFYSVVLEESTNTFKFGVLQEFENPSGVFIIIETNFLSPHLSAYN